MQITSEYKNEMLVKLMEMGDGETRKLETEDPQYAMKVEAIKIIINWGQDLQYGFTVYFNDTYTKIKKLNWT